MSGVSDEQHCWQEQNEQYGQGDSFGRAIDDIDNRGAYCKKLTNLSQMHHVDYVQYGILPFEISPTSSCGLLVSRNTIYLSYTYVM